MQCSFQHCYSPASTQTSSPSPKPKATVCQTAGQAGTRKKAFPFLLEEFAAPRCLCAPPPLPTTPDLLLPLPCGTAAFRGSRDPGEPTSQCPGAPAPPPMPGTGHVRMGVSHIMSL